MGIQCKIFSRHRTVGTLRKLVMEGPDHVLIHPSASPVQLPSFHFGVLRLLLAAKNAAGAENGHDRNSDNVHVERGSPEALVCNASGVCSLSQEIEG
jgi:hypothetical protein